MATSLLRQSLQLLAALLILATPSIAAEPLRVFLRVGPKTHGPNQHEHPRFLAEWSELLRARGCEVDGGMEFPTEAQLDAADVLVMYAADAGSIHAEERARLEAFLVTGGGIVAIHDAVCGDAPEWYQGVIGGAWEHGHSKWQEGPMGLYLDDREHPITSGAQNFDMLDEIYWDLHFAPDAHVLASSFHTPFDVKPQMWTYERDNYRAFVSLPGHEWSSFEHPAYRTLLLRGIAWAGKRDADLLVSPEEVAELRYPRGGPQVPEKAHEGIELHPDFELSLVAAEPLIQNPISIEWDARGRMWVACTPGYPDKAKFSGIPAHDYIAILFDASGDGRMDTRQIFHEGLDLVTSLLPYRDGVIVCSSPDILWLRDTDRDDVADEVVTLFSGFGTSDTHATISNLRWGLDGWVYATQGYSGNASNHVIGLDGTDHGKIGNGLFRFKPDGSAIETVVSYGSNTWGCDFSWDGELFFTMANGSHLRHVVLPDGVLAEGRFGEARSWRDITDHRQAHPISQHTRAPYLQIDFVGGFTAAAGCDIYEGGAWPDAYRGDHFVTEPTINLVHRDTLTPGGVSFEASKPREPEFLASSDLWFRPVHLTTGPDGAMYLLDFYNQAAVHNDTRGPEHGPTNAAVRPDRDHLHGRIWRIQHREARALAQPDLSRTGNAAVVEALGHPNAWQRMTAQRRLVESPVMTPVIQRALAPRTGLSPEESVHRLWVRHHLGLLEERELAVAFESDSAGVRKNAARLARLSLASWKAESNSESAALATWLPGGLGDPDTRVRLEVLTTLGDENWSLTPEGLGALARACAELEDDVVRSAALRAAARAPVQFVAALAATDVSNSRNDAFAEALAHHVASRAEPDAIVDLLLATPKASALRTAVLKGLGAAPLPADLQRADELAGLLRVELASADLQSALAALPLTANWTGARSLRREVDGLARRLRAIVEDWDEPAARRIECLETLLAMPAHVGPSIPLAANFVDPFFPPEQQLRVIEALDRSAHASAAKVLIAAFPTLSNAGREAIFNAIARQAEWTGLLLDELERKDLRPNDLGPGRLFRLRNHPDDAVATRANALLDTLQGALKRETDTIIAELLPIVTQPGDAARGEELFGTHCATCHTYQGAGAHVGPDLSGMGVHGPAGLLPFVVDPNRAVEDAYVEYVAKTVDGRVEGGVLVEETPDSIVLRNTSGDVRIGRVELEELRSTGRSPMPTGLEEIGAEALRDVFAYLCESHGGFRVVDLGASFTNSTERGLYDERRESRTYEFTRFGVHEVDGIPFELTDPVRSASGDNVIVLRGGMAGDWDCKLKRPTKVEIPVGYALERVHVLGGVAAWGFPFTREQPVCVRWTWHYADGGTESAELIDGVHFADWIRPQEVPGSKAVKSLLRPGTRGQLRRFSLAPSRAEVIEKITLESFDGQSAPTFLALTAQLDADALPEPELWDAGSAVREEDVSEIAPVVRDGSAATLVFGGGSSHDFARWFGVEDVRALGEAGLGPIWYDESPGRIIGRLPGLELLVLCNNQALPGRPLRDALFAHVAGGGGLLLVHAATWYNWSDWPGYNRRLVSGGARGHEPLREFEVRVVDAEHPVTAGLPATFRITDELYRFERDPEGSGVHVLAEGVSLETGAVFPVAWTVEADGGRVLCITLGHDGAAHQLSHFRKLLRQAAAWAVSAD